MPVERDANLVINVKIECVCQTKTYVKVKQIVNSGKIVRMESV